MGNVQIPHCPGSTSSFGRAHRAPRFPILYTALMEPADIRGRPLILINYYAQL